MEHLIICFKLNRYTFRGVGVGGGGGGQLRPN